MTSTIYDLGYQSYTGPRHGRAHSFWTLVVFSFRACFGLGRGEQARRIPVVIAVLVFAPALVQVGVASATGLQQLIHYANYLDFTAILLALFAAAQGPEIIVTDRQNGALTLYLSRPIRATDYALAKLLALTAAMLVLTLFPQLVLFGGKVLIAKAPFTAFKSEASKLMPIFGGTIVVSFFFASISLGLSSFAVRRAFASAAVIAFFMLMPAFAIIVRLVTVGSFRRWAVLLNPGTVVVGFTTWLFEIEASRRSAVGRADLPPQAYLWVILAVCTIAVAILLNRYRKNET